ncbi:MAG TPA: phosphoribosylformylglycinamidine synthase subunit PurS, partial [Spirochaetes bacterium]|nr:phosphoribosylformylglycinamidine synthase subunit PurS [Spirochaetota bacterium]
MYRIEVSVKEGFADPRAEGLEKDILDLGINSVARARVSDIYLLDGDIAEAEVRRICTELLADPIVNDYTYDGAPVPPDAHLVEVRYNPGVMDPV